MDNTFKQIQELMNKWMDPVEEIVSPDVKFADLEFDILDYVEMVILVENMFGIELEDDAIEKLDKWSVKELCDYIETRPKIREEPVFTAEEYFNKFPQIKRNAN